MELTGAERAVAWLGLLAAIGVLLVSADLLTGGRLFGWSAAPVVDVEGAGDE